MIKSVKTNFKNFASATHNMNRVTVIAGGNGIGKTALIQAMQVATSGEVGAVQSRSIKRAGRITEIFQNTSNSVTFSDGYTASYVVKNGIPATIPPNRPVVWLTPTITSLWIGSEKNMIAKLLSVCAVQDELVWKLFPLQDHVKKCKRMLPADVEIASVFSKLGAQADIDMKAANKKVKDLKDERSRLSATLDNVVLKDVSNLEASLAEKKAELATTVPVFDGTNCPHCSHTEGGTANPRYMQLRSSIDSLTQQIAAAKALNEAYEPTKKRLERLPTLIREEEDTATMMQSIKAAAATANTRLFELLQEKIANVLNVLLPFEVIVDLNNEFPISKKIVTPEGEIEAGYALGGAEEVNVIIAIGTLLADKTKHNILLYPDVGWHPDFLSDTLVTMNAVSEQFPHIQYIIQSTVLPSQDVSDLTNVSIINLESR